MVGLRVFVTDSDYPTLDLERAVMERAGIELVSVQCRTEEEVVRLCAGADGLLNQYAPLSRRVMSQLGRCRAIARFGVGVDNVDLAAATDAGIAVCNVPDYGVEEVSDHALALLLSAARKVNLLDRAVRSGIWEFSIARPVRRLLGQTLGVVGMGRIGKALARKAAGLGFRILGFDPPVGQVGAVVGPATMTSLEDLLRQADYVSVHVPLTPETRHLFNERTLRLFKPSAVLINVARGGVIDTAALATALREGWIAGAALDVFEQEPIPRDHILLRMENCIVTPHSAWYSEDAFIELKTKAAEEVAAILTGGSPRYCLNPEVLRPSGQEGVSP